MCNVNNAKTGFNAALFTDVTPNTENEDTNYKSGAAFHADISVQYLLLLGPGFISAGLNAFYYQQIEGDIGIGPALGYILPCGENTLVVEARWLPELDTQRRFEGDFFWLKAEYQC